MDEKYNGAALGDRSRHIIQQVASIADVDRFMFDVWGVIPEDSPVEDELRKTQRRPLMIRLVELLRRRGVFRGPDRGKYYRVSAECGASSHFMSASNCRRCAGVISKTRRSMYAANLSRARSTLISAAYGFAIHA